MEIRALHAPLGAARREKKPNIDENVVRNALVKAWTRTLEAYARPGAAVPSADVMRRELLRIGEEAAIKALRKEHWFVFSFMVHDLIHQKIERELNRFDLDDFLADVREAQHDPAFLEHLKDKIRRNILRE